MARLSDSITYGNHAITGDVDVRGSLTVKGGEKGDIYYHNGIEFVKLPAGSTGQVLEMNSNGLPVWSDKTIG